MDIPRAITPLLIEWKNNSDRKPLIIRGARQVGKTHAVTSFGKKYFKHCFSLNFEKDRDYQKLFETSQSISKLLAELEVLSRLPITQGQTLVFFDEIQACPRAIELLRYFYEEAPQCPVIAAGSLLEFVLEKNISSFPVGRVTMRYMYPLSFEEYLLAEGEGKLLDYFHNLGFNDPAVDVIHEKSRQCLRHYLLLGGMPKVVHAYLTHKNLLQTEEQKQDLIQTFRDDFRKYGNRVNTDNLDIAFREAAHYMGQQFNYGQMGLDSRHQALQATGMLEKAMLLRRVRPVQSVSFPLIPRKKSVSKIIFLDVGLAQFMSGISSEIIHSDNLSSVYKGGIAEQFVGQTLLTLVGTHSHPELFFWQSQRKSAQSEIDFVYPYQAYLIPIEVKYGKGGALASLHQFMHQHKAPVAIRIYDGPLRYETLKIHLPQNQKAFSYRLLSLPLYLIHELPRFLTQVVAGI